MNLLLNLRLANGGAEFYEAVLYYCFVQKKVEYDIIINFLPFQSIETCKIWCFFELR